MRLKERLIEISLIEHISELNIFQYMFGVHSISFIRILFIYISFIFCSFRVL